MDSVVVVESKSGDRLDFTTIQWQIRLGETLCYKFSDPAHQDQVSAIEVTYQNIRHVYSIANSYYFRLAQTKVQCNCDCPAGGNSCNSQTDSCDGRPNCVNYYSNAVSSQGCFLKFLKLSSALCCSIEVMLPLPLQVKPHDSRRLRAIELSVPNVIATFQVKHRNSDGVITDARVYNIDLNAGTSVDWEVSLQVGSAGPTHSMPGGWYIEDPADSFLLGNLPINGLDEWDVSKLGWFKSRSPTENHMDSTGQQIIRQAFKVQVENCALNSYKYQFFRGFMDHNQLDGGRRVEIMYPFIQSTSVWRRHVEVTHRESPLLVMTMQHRTKVDVVMQYHESALADFSGLLQIDMHSNAFLNLTLKEVMGSIHGTLTSNNFTQVLQVSVGGQLHQQVEKRLKVVGLVSCHPSAQISVTLRPYGGKSRSSITRHVACTVDSMRHFRQVKNGGMVSKNVLPPSSLSCLGCSNTWLYYIDPYNWSDSLWTST
eukprot:14457.XXX_467503_458791_1 [CDS] Oithona nana genome sequencing.